METRRQRVVIVGGGFGGLRTALHLARRRTHDIVLIDRSDVHVYTPWLYEVASGRTDDITHASEHALRHSATLPFADILRGTNITFRKAEVADVDVAHNNVVFADKTTLSYDALVLAVGCDIAYFGIPGLQEHALTIKSLADTERVHARIEDVLALVQQGQDAHIMVAGAGPSGVELIAELATMVRARERRGTLLRGHVRFSLVDAEHRVLTMCSPRVSRKTEARLHALGITTMLDTLVTKVTDSHVVLAPRPQTQKDTEASRAVITVPTEVPYACCIWCGGVQPGRIAAAWSLPKDARGRVTVDATYEVTGHTNIFVLGDVAVCADVTRSPVPQTAQAADVISATVAANVTRALARRALVPFVALRSWPFVITIGARYGIAEIIGVLLTGFPAYVLRRAIDLRYLSRILGPLAAYRAWRLRMKLYAEND